MIPKSTASSRWSCGRPSQTSPACRRSSSNRGGWTAGMSEGREVWNVHHLSINIQLWALSPHLAKLSILETELNEVPASVAAFSLFFLNQTFHYLWVIAPTIELNFVHLNSSLARKQRMNWWKTEIFFSVWVCANLMLSDTELECWGHVSLLIKTFLKSNFSWNPTFSYQCNADVLSWLGHDGALWEFYRDLLDSEKSWDSSAKNEMLSWNP